MQQLPSVTVGTDMTVVPAMRDTYSGDRYDSGAMCDSGDRYDSGAMRDSGDRHDSGAMCDT